MEDEVLGAEEPLSARVPADLHGQRLDAVAAALFTDFSRSRLAEWIKAGRLQRNQSAAKPRDKVAVDDQAGADAGGRGSRVEWVPETSLWISCMKMSM